MHSFTDEEGTEWVARAKEENTPRHHTRWYLVFQAAAGGGPTYPMAEVRWQTEQTADRTLRTMSVFELRKRLSAAKGRQSAPPGAD